MPHAKDTRTLSSAERRQLTELLWACSSMSRRESREAVLRDLRKEITAALLRGFQNDLLDIRSIVDGCLNYIGGST
jgi:hypothetical protein